LTTELVEGLRKVYIKEFEPHVEFLSEFGIPDWAPYLADYLRQQIDRKDWNEGSVKTQVTILLVSIIEKKERLRVMLHA
jgi:hypothetical protein